MEDVICLGTGEIETEEIEAEIVTTTEIEDGLTLGTEIETETIVGKHLLL